MNEYYVEKIVEENVFDRQVMWGVYRREHSDSEMMTRPKENLNLILWCYEKLAAEKIAEVLNMDDYIHERYYEEN